MTSYKTKWLSLKEWILDRSLDARDYNNADREYLEALLSVLDQIKKLEQDGD